MTQTTTQATWPNTRSSAIYSASWEYIHTAADLQKTVDGYNQDAVKLADLRDQTGDPGKVFTVDFRSTLQNAIYKVLGFCSEPHRNSPTNPDALTTRQVKSFTKAVAKEIIRDYRINNRWADLTQKERNSLQAASFHGRVDHWSTDKATNDEIN